MNKETIRTIILIIIVAVFAFSNMSMAKASTKSDLKIAKNWAKSHYSEPIKVVNDFKVPEKEKEQFTLKNCIQNQMVVVMVTQLKAIIM